MEQLGAGSRTECVEALSKPTLDVLQVHEGGRWHRYRRPACPPASELGKWRRRAKADGRGVVSALRTRGRAPLHASAARDAGSSPPLRYELDEAVDPINEEPCERLPPDPGLPPRIHA